MNTLFFFCLDTRLYKSDREIVIARRHRVLHSSAVILVFFPHPTPRPTNFSPVRNPPRIPTPFSCVYRYYYYYYSYFFLFSLASLANEFNPISPIENRRSSNLLPFFFFFFSLLTLEQRDHHVSLVLSRIARATERTIFFFFFFSLSLRIESSNRRHSIARQNFEPRICSFVRSIDRSIDRSLVAAMANTDELSVVKFSFHYV